MATHLLPPSQALAEEILKKRELMMMMMVMMMMMMMMMVMMMMSTAVPAAAATTHIALQHPLSQANLTPANCASRCVFARVRVCSRARPRLVVYLFVRALMSVCVHAPNLALRKLSAHVSSRTRCQSPPSPLPQAD